MAFFKFRKGGDDSQATPQQTESVDAMRRRARHRLIGAAVLVLIGVVGFPLLFDTQPRPIAVDIPIEIPDRNKARPLVVPPQPAQAAASESVEPAPAVVARAPAASAAVTPAPAAAVPKAPAEPKKEAVITEMKEDAKPAPKPEVKVAEKKPLEAKPAETKAAEAKPAVKPETKSDDGAKALALLEGKPDAAAAGGRFVVQVGAFADSAVAQETRRKVEKAGLKTYTHVAETKEGKRIRVRVGPFATRDEAAKAADRIKGLDLPAAILTL